jgi:hypothetical protein
MALREILAKFGFQIDSDKLENMKSQVDGARDKVKEFAGLIAGSEVFEKVKSFVLEMEDMAGQLQDTSDRLGVNAQELQRWNLAAKFAGAEAGEVAVAMKVLQQNAADAASGAGTAAGNFKALGVSVKDLEGGVKPANEVLEDTLIALSKIENPTLRSGKALDVLGRGGLALLPMIKDGPEGLDKLLGKLDELGGGIGEDAMAVLGDTGDRLDEFNFSILSLKSRLSVTLIPSLNEALGWFTKMIAVFSKTTEGTQVFQAAAIVLGVVAGRVAISLYAKYLPIIAVIALLILLVDDVITAFKGGDSVIGKVIDKLLGPGAGKDFFKWISEGVDDLGKRLSKMTSIGDMIEEIFSSIGFTIVKFFVDDIPEAWEFFWKDINKSIGSKGKTFSDFLKTMFTDIWNWIKNWVKDTANDLVDGLVNGLKKGWEKGTGAIKKLFKGLLGTAEDEADINSPSGETDWQGQMLGQGWINGLLKMLPGIRAQAKEVVLAATPATTYAPVIRFPTIPSARGPASNTIDQRNNIQVTVYAQDKGVAAATRNGVGQAMQDDRRALLASLEMSVE